MPKGYRNPVAPGTPADWLTWWILELPADGKWTPEQRATWLTVLTAMVDWFYPVADPPPPPAPDYSVQPGSGYYYPDATVQTPQAHSDTFVHWSDVPIPPAEDPPSGRTDDGP